MHHPQLPFPFFHFGGYVSQKKNCLTCELSPHKRFSSSAFLKNIYNYCRWVYTFFKVVTAGLKPDGVRVCLWGGGLNRRLCFQI